MKITKKAKGIILAGAVALTINAATITNVTGGITVGSTAQQSKTSAIDPPGN